MVRERAGLPAREQVNTREEKERSFDLLADACRKHLDIDAIMKMMNEPVL
jgi:cobyric acid synthase